MGQFTSNQYTRKYAANDAGNKIKKANSRKNEIISASKVIFEIEEKYIQKLQQKASTKNYVSSKEEFVNSSDGKKEEIQNAFKENPIKGLKVWWGKQSKISKIIWIAFFVLMMIAALGEK